MTLVLIEPNKQRYTRYVEGKKTHQAFAAGRLLEPEDVEAFRINPPEEFLLIVSPEAA